MKRKIKYGKIPKKILNTVIGECYNTGDYTLKDELDKYGEDILAFRYTKPLNRITMFQAWTKNYTMILIDTFLNDQTILGLLREIPHELKND